MKRIGMRPPRWLVWTTAVFVLLAGSLWGVWALANARSFQLYGGLTDRVDTQDKVVALTFDDGPTELTPAVLRHLADAGVRATFFLTGRELAAHREQGAAIARAGHEIGNHTYTHARMWLVGTEFVASEVERTDEEIRRTGYSGEITFRPPNGKKLVSLPRYLDRHQRKTIMWDVEPESDGTDANDPAAITRAVVDQVRPGSIVLLHVMYPARTASMDAVPGVLTGLKERGYRFVTISELLAAQR
ncbi:peptidoglycan/xylan/chitin deacetylase (PgdA/CDA1 family) [Crossiella equi]|uniref:Peptidoglycan/xylan/chitin deacetylase (PgdA/CDA1 family) n=1 Tax=Crossiella equi TaxID=130796 RepID=A0ABS5A4C8_9PSEU|nr:polysaccharide deacetylase family protein [Crossiella equi]MBP2471428.1 peptidoglycan/xylan/chitin deacetylase (PgdA/CDA1 family) [Crossiella equi]